MSIDNTDDIIDSRDVIARIEELEEERDDIESDDTLDAEHVATNLTEWDADNGDELRALKALADQAEGYCEDWHHGATLIRDSYFREYAQQFAEDIGAINPQATWPNNCIDWDKAANELQSDYSAVEFDDVTYWVR